MTSDRPRPNSYAKYTTRYHSKENKLYLAMLGLVSLTVIIALVLNTTLTYVCAGLVLGTLYVRIFSMFHEHMHGTFLDHNSILGRLLRVMVKTLMATDSVLWAIRHNKHHREVGYFGILLSGAIGTVTVEQYMNLTWKEKLLYRIVRNPIILFPLGYISIFVLYFNLSPVIKKGFFARWNGVKTLAIHWGFVMLSCLALGVVPGLSLTLLPAFCAAAIGVCIFYLQHVFEGAKYVGDVSRPQVDRIYETTSKFEASRFTLWIMGDLEYHHIHHIHPMIPFYRCREASEAEPALQDCLRLRLTPKSIIKALGCFVWDSEAGQFLSRSQLKKRSKIPVSS